MFKLKQSSPRACWIVGHRGAMGHAPENTFSSFDEGRHMGAEFVECDVHLSKDNEIIVMHDESVDRTTNGAGLIKNLKLSQIKKLDAGSWYSKKFKGERVPTLKELLEWARHKTALNKYQMGVAIEIKNEPVNYPAMAEKLVQAVNEAGMGARVVVISFDHDVLKQIKKIDPKIATGILYSEPLKNPIQRAIDVQADALFPRRTLITQSLVQKAHQKGLAVATWTVNEVPEMKRLLACKIDAIATNFPDRLNKII